MTNLPEKILLLNQSLQKLEKSNDFLTCQATINQVVNFLGIDSSNSWKLFVDSNGKIRSNASWFMMAEGFADKRASYTLANENDRNIDIKVYWTQRTSKSIVSWLVALTPNFEDETFYSKKNIGIDFIIPEKADRVIVVLSQNYIVRTLELKGELSLTQQEIFAKWLQDFDFANKEQVHNILWNSFDLEPLNKRFYKEVSSFFVELKHYLSDKKIFNERYASLFTNRLIGRIIFCWFLEKKDIINKDFAYFDIKNKNSTEYYREKLETLFFRVFNTLISERDKGIDDKTPFLNGGLFEPREHDKFNDSALTFPADYFDRFFTFLNHYNFTTDESTSAFQQVAIDPEMLGRIFENLLAEQTEETGEQARKAKGAFYTPREIVDYMCKESLREYLKTKIQDTADRDDHINKLIDSKPHEWRDQQRNFRDKIKFYKPDISKALDDVKILDPACGSGAFPMGMMQLLLTIYERLEPRFNPYTTKLDIIKNNIYGVDIEPMAVEIARLRAWLSIVVDEGTDSSKIEPLPNLDFKFICANSLIPLDKSGQASFGDNPKLEEEMLAIRNDYFKAWSTKGKKKLEDKFNKLIAQKNQANLLGKSKKQKQLESYHPFDSENVSAFFDPDFMFGIKDGFSIVIGNPPYVQLQKSGGSLANMYQDCGFESFARTGDIYALFYEFGNKVLKQNGFLAFITSNKWMRAGYGEKLRKYLSENTTPKLLIDLGPGVFATATVDTNILISQKGKKEKDCLACSVKQNLVKSKIKLEEYIKNNSVQINNFTSKSWVILNPIEQTIKNKIEKAGTPLKDWDVKINRGVLTGFNEAFVISGEKKDELIKKDPKSAEIIKPVLGGKSLERYEAKFTDLWLIATLPVMKLNIDDYPAIKEYLLSFGRKLEQNGKKYIDKNRLEQKSRKKTCNKWFETQDQICYYKEFEKEKIVWLNLNRKWKYSYVKPNIFVEASLNFISTNKYAKFLTAILSSKLHLFYFKMVGRMHDNGGFMCKIDTISNFPVPKVSLKIQKPFIELVDQIIEKKKENPKADTSDLEKEIDKMVYELYCLTEEEIGIIEKSN